MIKFISALIVLLAAAFLAAISAYDLFASWMARLRGRGPVGVFLADLIVAPEVRVFLFIAAIILIAWGIKENLSLRKRVGTGKEKKLWYETSENDLISEDPQKPQVADSIPPSGRELFTVTAANPEHIVVDVTAGYLMEQFDERTTAEAQRIVLPYIGKWIEATAPIHDVSQEGRETQLVLTPKIESRKTRLMPGWIFVWGSSQEWKDRASVLKRGDIAHVEGQILRIGASAVTLAQARFISVENQSHAETRSDQNLQVAYDGGRYDQKDMDGEKILRRVVRLRLENKSGHDIKGIKVKAEKFNSLGTIYRNVPLRIQHDEHNNKNDGFTLTPGEKEMVDIVERQMNSDIIRLCQPLSMELVTQDNKIPIKILVSAEGQTIQEKRLRVWKDDLEILLGEALQK